ncbi:farnesyl pyrophosphate synthase-like [Thrips palmi]|uniref:Farnesyl pyrophosphate synthase-like n=1 Tax=Thrips palmi TaxID=161013 RepID=A0A6P9A7Y4_THRPL|nr:farnesyl pyrophosphate synthase-like [Thrips palmi]
MNASYGIVDDLVDGGVVRWDKPAWCKLPEVGLASAFDGILVENLVFQVLRQQFKGSPCYEELVDLFLETTFGFYLGQNDDIHIAKPGRAMLEDFTLTRYQMAARLKTSLIEFYSPVAAALLACGVQDPKAYAAARDISVDMSLILQIVDDYNDCFGDDKSDVSLDIRNGCCTWMILEAKKIANASQKKILQENYGYDDQSKVDVVKQIFDELGLKKRVMDYRQMLFHSVIAKIEQNAEILPPNIYNYALEIHQDYSVEWCQRNQVE